MSIGSDILLSELVPVVARIPSLQAQDRRLAPPLRAGDIVGEGAMRGKGQEGRRDWVGRKGWGRMVLSGRECEV